MAVLCQLTSWKRSPLASTCRSKLCDGSRDMAHEGITSRGSAVAALIGLERLGSPIQEVHVPLAHQSALESP